MGSILILLFLTTKLGKKTIGRKGARKNMICHQFNASLYRFILKLSYAYLSSTEQNIMMVSNIRQEI